MVKIVMTGPGITVSNFSEVTACCIFGNIFLLSSWGSTPLITDRCCLTLPSFDVLANGDLVNRSLGRDSERAVSL